METAPGLGVRPGPGTEDPVPPVSVPGGAGRPGHCRLPGGPGLDHPAHRSQSPLRDGDDGGGGHDLRRGRAAQRGQERPEGRGVHLPSGGPGHGRRRQYRHHAPCDLRQREQGGPRHEPAPGHHDQQQPLRRGTPAQRGVQLQQGQRPGHPAGEGDHRPEAGGGQAHRHHPRFLCGGPVGGRGRAGGRHRRRGLRRAL